MPPALSVDPMEVRNKGGLVGQPIPASAAFQAARGTRSPMKSRLKAGCSQDWLPHDGYSLRDNIDITRRYSPSDEIDLAAVRSADAT
jgi:hypothetical protein